MQKEDPATLLGGADGILVPGGFGMRGIEGKIEAVRYARENNIPYFGICLGMQCAVIEYARHVLGLPEANSTEFAADTRDPVICILEEQKTVTHKGGTMRLGAQPCILRKPIRSRPAVTARGRSANGIGTATSSIPITASSSSKRA